MKKLYVIGSSSAISLGLAQLGGDYSVVFIGRTNPHNLSRYIKSESAVDESSVDRLLAIIIKDLDASRGIESASLVVLSGVSTHDWRESFLVNEYLPARLSEGFAQYVSGLSLTNTSITLVGSAAAYQGAKMPYATTKAALGGVLHTIARDFSGRVRVNLVLPGAFESNMTADWDDTKRQSVASNNHIGRLGTGIDMADAILFAVRNRFITNSTINMTGGAVHV